MSEPHVSLDLDAFEEEIKPEPFSTRLGGRKYTLIGAEDSDFRELLKAQRAAEAGDIETAITIVVRPEDQADFFANKLSVRQLTKLFDAYNKHYGLPTSGEAGASPRS